MCSYGNKASTPAQVMMKFILKVNEAVITCLESTCKKTKKQKTFYSKKKKRNKTKQKQNNYHSHETMLFTMTSAHDTGKL